MGSSSAEGQLGYLSIIWPCYVSLSDFSFFYHDFTYDDDHCLDDEVKQFLYLPFFAPLAFLMILLTRRSAWDFWVFLFLFLFFIFLFPVLLSTDRLAGWHIFIHNQPV